MAIGKAGAKNAALLALAILGISDPKISAKLINYKKQMRLKVIKTKIKL
jgi:5-(carboxyamino)imidazole ribonucleotide mutase